MRLSLVAHGFPPLEKAGVENFTAQLARGLAVRGHAVEVFVPRVREDLPDLSLRREERDGYGIQWLTTNSSPGDPREALDPPGCAEQFDQFLERERPELVHFHHVAKLGLGLIGAAHARRIPTVYTVHDYFPICHRIALLRPDLERCETIGDPQACARCDLALSVLNQQDTLGDYHLGVLPGQLDAEEAERLGATLAGRQDAVGFPAEEWQAATELRTELDLRRREAFRQVDRLIAPTRFLAERMVDGGLDRERIVHLPYGIDTSTLLGVPCANTAQLEARPLRVGFIGSLTKHKGVHVLLDAWEQLSPEAELHLWGDSTDRVYVERCREQAERIGARMHGAFEQRHLAQILARVDLVVVPSIWVENYPIAIREALAAGRPVLASDVGAIPESVRDGVDGRLFRVGDAADLARVLGELLADPASVVRLRNGAAPVCGLEAQVRDHERIYAEVAREVAARRPAKPAVLPHLEAISARREELLELSSAELFARS
ncbi:MAG: glycosyltransferase family 4 protein, partial [Planctomycetota bacterium]